MATPPPYEWWADENDRTAAELARYNRQLARDAEMATRFGVGYGVEPEAEE